MQGWCSFQIGDPPPLFLRLADRGSEVVSVLGKCPIGKRKVARRVEGSSQGRSMSCTLPVLVAFSVLGAKVVERLDGRPSLVMVQAMCEEQGELEQARAEGCLGIQPTATVFVFQKRPPFYKSASATVRVAHG